MSRSATIIAITNQKGGVGKTTTSVNLAAALQACGRPTLVVDCDSQGNCTMGCGIDKMNLPYSLLDLLLGEVTTAEVLQKTAPGGFSVIGANSDLTAAEVHLMQIPQGRETVLRQVLHDSSLSQFEYILLDCPPSMGMMTLNALTAADQVIVPIQCEYYALEGLSALLKNIQRIQKNINRELKISGLLRTMYDSRNGLTREVSAQLLSHFGELVFHTVIPRNVKLAEAPSHGLPVIYYDKQSRGALAYRALASEIVQRQSSTVTGVH